MNLAGATKIFEALSSQIRLNIVCLLVQHSREGLVAGEISQQLGLASTSLSFHLKILLNAGLVTVEQEGRFSRYRQNPATIRAVIKFISLKCQAGLMMELPKESALCWVNLKQAEKCRKT